MVDFKSGGADMVGSYPSSLLALKSYLVVVVVVMDERVSVAVVTLLVVVLAVVTVNEVAVVVVLVLVVTVVFVIVDVVDEIVLVVPVTVVVVAVDCTLQGSEKGDGVVRETYTNFKLVQPETTHAVGRI